MQKAITPPYLQVNLYLRKHNRFSRLASKAKLFCCIHLGGAYRLFAQAKFSHSEGEVERAIIILFAGINFSVSIMQNDTQRSYSNGVQRIFDSWQAFGIHFII